LIAHGKDSSRSFMSGICQKFSEEQGGRLTDFRPADTMCLALAKEAFSP